MPVPHKDPACNVAGAKCARSCGMQLSGQKTSIDCNCPHARMDILEHATQRWVRFHFHKHGQHHLRGVLATSLSSVMELADCWLQSENINVKSAKSKKRYGVA